MGVHKHALPAVLALALLVTYGAGMPAHRHAAGIDPEQQLQTAVTATLRKNVQLAVPVVYPSPAYYNPYLRDSFWVSQALGDRRFAIRVLAAFAGAERPDGDPPTYFVNAYRFPRYHDDESAALVLIWAWRNATLYGATPPRAALQHALSYLLRRTREGSLVTPPGRFAVGGMPIACRLPTRWPTARGSMQWRCSAPTPGSATPRARHRAGRAGLPALYDRRLGYLRLSRGIPASDASALTGEFLSLWLFGHAMLPDATVLSTLRHLPPFGAGFRVVVMPGQPRPVRYGLRQQHRLRRARATTRTAARGYSSTRSLSPRPGLHGLHDALPRLRARLALEFRYGAVLHEYLRTDPALPYYGAEPPYRDHFSWDSFVLVIDHVLHKKTKIT